MIKSLVFTFDVQKPIAEMQALQVTLITKLSAPVSNAPSFSMTLSKFLSEPLPDKTAEILPKLDFVETKSIENQDKVQLSNQTQATLIDKIPDTSNYYASNEVERKALPQLNIDMSDIDASGYSGLPIKLRLYINTYGRLVRIERLAEVIDQDEAYISALEKLLSDLVYMPAKKDSLDVNAYQDMILSFNPLSLPTQPPDSNLSID